MPFLLPFVWPGPSFDAAAGPDEQDPPLDAVVRSATSVFGVVSAIDASAVDWMDTFLTEGGDRKIRIVVSIHPTCRTSTSDLQDLMRLADRYENRAAFKIFPEKSLLDRSSNLLCFHATDATTAIFTGPTENMGFAPPSPSQGNLASAINATTFETCRKWFDYLWAMSGPLRPEVAASMPRLVLPKGDSEAARQWEEYRQRCLDHTTPTGPVVRVQADPDSGEAVLVDQDGNPLPSPTEEIGVPTLDPLEEAVARVFELGVLVSVEKIGRIPPLEAPVKPEWFNLESFRQRGTVRAQTAIKVAPFDAATLAAIDRLRSASGKRLPRFSFALADGVRWIPKRAIPLFEAELSAANEKAKELLGRQIGESVESFLASQHERIRKDAQAMYETYHSGATIPEEAVSNIMKELRSRLDRTRAAKLLPSVAYSPVAFNPAKTSEWSSPWGQAFLLLKGVAEFPRRAMTDAFFWRGLKTDEDQLVQSMNVADDYLVPEYGDRKAKQRAAIELELIKQLEQVQVEAREKCRALWTLIKTGKTEDVTALVGESMAESN